MPEAIRWWCGICKAFVPVDSVHDGHDQIQGVENRWIN